MSLDSESPKTPEVQGRFMDVAEAYRIISPYFSLLKRQRQSTDGGTGAVCAVTAGKLSETARTGHKRPMPGVLLPFIRLNRWV
ncbi:hypothetical protein [Paenibacillus sp. 1P03SA]|uniref:hypothetical protein n=1 Tax=Paenibacillus sp. 1P03SA TaxID=3132294 RepID=UPI0039A207C5